MSWFASILLEFRLFLNYTYLNKRENVCYLLCFQCDNDMSLCEYYMVIYFKFTTRLCLAVKKSRKHAVLWYCVISRTCPLDLGA